MLAEIFMVRLEATSRVSQETPTPSNSRFVPFNLGAQSGFKAEREKALTRSVQHK